MAYGSFEDLEVWKRSCRMAVKVYEILGNCRDYGLKDQMTRAAVSMASNIAEGDERNTNKEAIRFLYIAKGSLAELRTQMEIAHRINYITEEIFKNFENKALKIGRMLGKLIKARSNKK